MADAALGASLISATGAGAGQFDVNTIVSGLVDAETAVTAKRLDSREQETTAKISAFGELKSALSTFSGASADLSEIENFHQRYVTSSAPSVVTATTHGQVAPGNYSLEVSQLAQSHSLASVAFEDAATDTVGTGTLTVNFGSYTYNGSGVPTDFSQSGEAGSFELTIDSSNNTLSGVKDAINAANKGVSATVVNDGSGYRLVLSSSGTGKEMAMEIVAADDDGDNSDGDGLSRLVYGVAATQMTETAQGLDANLTINGLDITRTTNTVEGAVDGVTFNLLSAAPGETKTISIEQDREVISYAVNGFADAYNEMMGTIDDLMTLDETDEEDTDDLRRESSVRSLLTQIRREVGAMVEGLNGPYNALGDIGVSVQRDGNMTVDQDKLDDALLNNFDEVGRLFAESGVVDDGLVSLVATGDDLEPGEYAVNITQVATQGEYVAGSAASTFNIDEDNDSLSLKVDGIFSGTVFFEQKNYASGAELASEMEAKINASPTISALGAAVSVTYDDVDGFSITSNKFGSDSSVEIINVDSNTTQDFGIESGTGVGESVGVDVAGSIGGVVATGSGQRLWGAGSTEGVVLDVMGGAIGSRGSLHYSHGLAKRLDDLMTQVLDSSSTISRREDRLSEVLGEVSEERDELDDYTIELEDRYRSKYAMLDALMGQMEQTSSMIEAMIDSLNPSD